MAAYAITLRDTGETFACPEGRTLLGGMEALGRRGIPVGCRGGGCGVCKVRSLRGSWAARAMSRDHVSPEDAAAGVVLACRIRPTSDLEVEVVGAMRTEVCGARGACGAASINP